MLTSLYGKLSLALVALFGVLGAAFLCIVRFAADYHYEEITQRLNSSIVEYILQHEVLMRDGEINLADWEDLAHTVMIVNPTVEVYLLDLAGNLLAYDAPEEKIRRRRVDTRPIERFLAARTPSPLRGDDPRSEDGRKLFAAAPLEEDGRPAGYVYAILSSERYQAVAQNMAGSLMLRLSLIGVTVSVVFATVAGLLVFNLLTRRLRLLTRTVEAHRASDFVSDSPPRLGRADGDEVDRLALAFSDMAARIAEQVQALERLDGVRRELITNVSHDLRTPLAAMMGYIETLQLRGDIDDTVRGEYLSSARRHGVRLNRLIEQLFELSRLNSEVVAPRVAPFSITELICDVVQACELRARAGGVELAMELDHGVPDVRADIGLMQRVLENLIDNALGHTERGDRVHVRTRRLERRVMVEVSDTGCGIAEEDLPHIFERLYRAPRAGASPSATHRTGLGLAIVKRALELHDSPIQVRSRVGEGTTFRFFLRTVTAVEHA